MSAITCDQAVRALKEIGCSQPARVIATYMGTDSRAVATALRGAVSDGRVSISFRHKDGVARYRFVRLAAKRRLQNRVNFAGHDMDHKTKLRDLIPNGDGCNSEYANTLAEASEYIERLEDRLFAAGAMEQAPCFCCGYNGPGYYQPDSHPCAKRHHELRHGVRFAERMHGIVEKPC